MPKSGFKTKLYPNGEFSIGYVPDKRYDLHREPDPNLNRKGNLWWWHSPQLRRLVEARIAETPTPELGSSLPPNSHKRRGLSGITRQGSRLVRNAAHILQENYGRERLGFLTLTLPSLPAEDLLTCSREWPRIVRVFCQRLKRALEAAGLPSHYVGVTEIQEKRYQRTGEIALHLHIVFVSRADKFGDFALKPIQIRQGWLSVLSAVLERPIASRAVENVQVVKESAAGYLGKYMSKGASVCEAICDAGQQDYLPSAWYTCSLELKQLYRKSIVEKWDDELDVLGELPSLCLAEAVGHVHISTIELHGRSFMVGASGKLDLSKVKTGFVHIYRAYMEVYNRYAIHSSVPSSHHWSIRAGLPVCF